VCRYGETEWSFNINGKPKKGSFEIYMKRDGESEEKLVWTGLDKGPPRAQKFPDPESLIAAIEAS
jgi:hypothetical protein